MTTKEEKRELLHRKWEEQIAECESSNMPVKECLLPRSSSSKTKSTLKAEAVTPVSMKLLLR